MNRKIFYSILVMLLSVWLPARAQLSANFMPAVFGQTIEGLSHVQIINTYNTELRGRVNIRVREMNAGMVLTVRTGLFIIRIGSQEIDRTAFNSSRFSFGSNSIAAAINQTRRFPEGEYEYCFEIDITESKNDQLPPFYEYCFNQAVAPLTPLLLISPFDGEETCNKRPDFLWQPPAPLPPGSRFRLLLTEVKEEQDIIEAVNYNQPVINQANIPGNNLFYPSSAPELKEGKEYAWQVTCYNDKTVFKKSEIWTLRIKCKEEEKNPGGESYREMKEGDDGNFYITSHYLRFSVNNPYGAGLLNYSISSLDNQSVQLKKMPVLTINTGLNKYEIDLSDGKGLKNGQQYILKVTLANSRVLTLKFIYRPEKE